MGAASYNSPSYDQSDIGLFTEEICIVNSDDANLDDTNVNDYK